MVCCRAFLALVSVLIRGPPWILCLSDGPWTGPWTGSWTSSWTGPCPAMCSCEYEDDRTGLKVDCVDRGLSQVPVNVSDRTCILDLSMNRVAELQDGLSHLRSLRELRLAGNRLQRIHGRAFDGLHRLTALTMHDTDLRAVPSEALGRLPGLQSLRLDANRLSLLPPRSFRGLSRLRLLWLEDNRLRDVPGAALAHLPRLQALTLGMNRLTHLPPWGFGRLRELRVLLLHHNHIHSISPVCFYGLSQLHTLDLSFNRLCSFPSVFQPLTSLRELNLQNNRISFVPENGLRTNRPSLKTVNLQNNPLLVMGTVTKLSKPPTLPFPGPRDKPQVQHFPEKNALEYCQTQGSAVDLTLLLFVTIVFLTALTLSVCGFHFNTRDFQGVVY